MMSGLMGSLLGVLESKRDEAIAAMRAMPTDHEPEVVFYLARHFAMLNDHGEAVALVQRARAQGLASSFTLLNDEVFRLLKTRKDFRGEIDQACEREHAARVAFDRAGGQAILK